MTPSTEQWLLYRVGFPYLCGLFLAACASAPRIVAIPPVPEAVRAPAYGSKDYPEVLAAIMSFMVRDLNLPAVEGSVIVYPSQASYETGVVAESEKDLERLRKQLGSLANQLRAEESNLAARRLAVSSVAVGMYKKVLVNEWRAGNYSWSEWLRILAHELTHTAERELVDGRFTVSDQWLREGFADWVGYKVVETFGAEKFAKSRDHALDLIATARAYQNFPSLSQLARNAEWTTWLRNRGHAATYGQALIAVDFLIEQKGLPAIVEYFKLFGKLNNRERNFMAAFGEPLSAFEEKFNKHFQTLLKKTRDVAMSSEDANV